MLKRIAMILVIPIILAAFIPVSAAPTPVVPRVYRTEMTASPTYYNGEKYIALDVNIVDITEPTGLLGIDFDIKFDGDKLEPLWKTDAELNGNGVTYNPTTPPQMVTKWPTYTFSFMGNSFDIFAVEGLCRSYEKSGKGVLNVNLVTNIDVYEFAVFGDNELAVRLYFKPIGGFTAGETYTFTIDGQYDEPIKQYIEVGGVSNTKPIPGVAYGYGDSTSYTTTWADCGAFDLKDTTLSIKPDGAKGILWVDALYKVSDLKACFNNSVRVQTAAGGAVSDSGVANFGYKVSTSAGELFIAMHGDVNLDGNVSTMDYALIKAQLSGTGTLTDLQSKIADLNSDGALTTTDAVWFRRLF